jgi:RsiW-degrading membrane proteinase PrsW (M82 family)
MRLLILALAPVFVIAVYIYFRDKYEKEPIGQLIKSLVVGCLITLPIVYVEHFLTVIKPDFGGGWSAFYTAFVVAGTTEEVFKFLALFLLIWTNRNFNDKFDGIVYSVFISLGFAAIENIGYVFQNGESTAYTRAFLSVPGHALFGVTMGFYFRLAKFYPKQRINLLIKSLCFPILLHGIFDFILMLGNLRLMVIFIPYVAFLYFYGLRKMKNLSERSFFKS